MNRRRGTADADYHCAPCATGWRGHCAQGCDPGCDGLRECAGSRLAEMEGRRAAWDAEEQREYQDAYAAQAARSQRPDAWGCMRRLLTMRKRWLEEGR